MHVLCCAWSASVIGIWHDTTWALNDGFGEMKPSLLRAFVWRFTCLLALWWIWLGHEPASWKVGVPAICVATVASLRLAPAMPFAFSILGALRVLPRLVIKAVAGGWDVACRVMGKRVRVEPSWVSFTCELRGSFPKWCSVHCVSLLPGTLSVSLAGAEALVHVLGDAEEACEGLVSLEEDLAKVFPASIG